MLIAFDKNNSRILPRKGALGYCPQCSNKVKAYCGEIYIHHWKHLFDLNCDKWKENETEWHRSWKNEFPEDWREIVIERGHEKHRADIKTSNGLVVEFQNSSISIAAIREREDYYQDIVWVINANDFKSNFDIWSIVNWKLRQLESMYQSRISNYLEKNPKVEHIELELDKIESKIDDAKEDIKLSQSRIAKIEKLSDEIDSWVSKYLESKHLLTTELSDFNVEYSKEHKKLNERLSKNERSLADAKDTFTYINGLPNCLIRNHEHYKIVDYSDVASSSYFKCLFVERQTENSLFPTILKVKSEYEFERIKHNKNYILIVDSTEILKEKKEEIEQAIATITEIESQLYELVLDTKNDLSLFIKGSINNYISKIREAELQLNELHENLDIKKKALKVVELEIQQEEQEISSRMNKEKEEDKYKIMKKYKGLYGYNWKHRRKSWDQAQGELYIDFKNHIFKLMDNGIMRKLGKNEFIDEIKMWKRHQ